jgi:hypothetical protein
MKDACALCRFWASEDNRQGLCRRFPPTPLMLGFGQPSVLAGPQQGPQPMINSYYPAMLEHGWCGEFSPRLAS